MKKIWAFLLLFNVFFSQCFPAWQPQVLAAEKETKIVIENLLPKRVTVVATSTEFATWSNMDKSLLLDLSESAPVANFNADNSAILSFASSTQEELSAPVITQPENIISVEQQDSEINTSTSSEDVLQPEIPAESEQVISTTTESKTFEIYAGEIEPAQDLNSAQGEPLNEKEEVQKNDSPDLVLVPTLVATSTDAENVLSDAPDNNLELSTSTDTSLLDDQSSKVVASSTDDNVLPEKPTVVEEPFLLLPAIEFSGFTKEEINTDHNASLVPVSLKTKISFANLPALNGRMVLEYAVATSTWQEFSNFDLSQESSNAQRGGYFFANLPKEIFQNIQDLKIRMVYKLQAGSESGLATKDVFFLDGISLQTEYEDNSKPEDESELNLPDISPEEFSHLDFFSPLMELFMPADLSQNPITLGSKKIGFNSLPLQMLPLNVSTATPPTRLGQKVTYTNAYESTDLEYIMSDAGLKENIILKTNNHPSKFRYLTNLDKYDAVQTSSSTIVLFAKGHKGEMLYKRYVLSAPIMTDSLGSESSKLEFRVNKNVITLVPDAVWLKTASYPVIVDPNVDLSILNVSSFPVAGEFWTIGFTTLGQDTLTVTPGDQATLEDMEFSSLTCDGVEVSASVSVQGQISVNNWSCAGVGEIKFLDKKTGHHHMAFTFGEASQDAYNGANVWNGLAGDSNWATGGNWSLGTPPALADDVVINTAGTININSGSSINSLVVGNSGGGVASVLNFNYDASTSPLSIVGNMTVYSGASITHTAAVSTSSTASVILGTINLNVSGNATVVGSINADSKGYPLAHGPGTPHVTNEYAGSGGSYGGIGSIGDGTQVGSLGATYGSSTAPTDLGSGSGKGCGLTAGASDTGGWGGGLIRMAVTGTTTVSGTISATGSTSGAGSPCWNIGSGSGGSVYLTTGLLSGAGTVSANGGYNNNIPAGGGGRVAVYYTTDNSTISFQAYGGNTRTNTTYRYAGAGTVYKKAASQTYGSLTISNNNNGGSDETLLGPTPITTTTTLDSLTVSGSAYAYLQAASTTLASTTTFNLSTNGMYEAATSTTLNYGSLNWGGMIMDSGGSLAVLNQNQDLTIPTSTKLILNIPNVTRTYNNLTVNGIYTHTANTTATSGTTSLYKLDTVITGNLVVGSSGVINADAKGYGVARGPGTPNMVNGYNGTGGSYGGVGSKGDGAQTGTLGFVYGSSTAPTDLGSGGGKACGNVAANGDTGLWGGGAIKLNVSGTTTINGIISATGSASEPIDLCWYPGAGSGGSVYLTTGILSGNGTVSVNGGGVSNMSSGGGGRVAVYYTSDNSNISFQAFGGSYRFSGSNERYAGAGTIYKKSSAQNYGTLLVANNAIGGNTETLLGLTAISATMTLDSLVIASSSYVYLNSASTTLASTTSLSIESNGLYEASAGTTLNYTSINWSGMIMDSGGSLAVLNQNQDLTISTSSKLIFNVLNGARTYNNITVNGILTHSANTSATTGSASLYKINWTANNNFTVGPSGSINLDSKGYVGGQGAGAGVNDNQAGGAGYGGVGGNSTTGIAGGFVYGSSTNPTSLGSGGGNSSCGSIGGTGGGALQLAVTGTTTILGTISANGGNGASSPCWNGGGGSGGSIYITSNVIAGTGTISANGGNGILNNSGNGAGGRVAVNYITDYSNFNYNVYTGSSGSKYGGSGSIYKKSSSQTYGDLIFDNNNYGSTNELIFGYSVIPTSTFDSLTIRNSASAYTASSATTTTLTLSNNGHYDAKVNTVLNYSSLSWSGIITDSGGSLAVLNQNQDLTISTSSKLIFNVLNGTRTYNNITVNGILTHSANTSATTGSASLYKINWTANNNFTVGPSGSINLDSKGYVGGQGLGKGTDNNQASGGGYGGKGGASGNGTAGGIVYGSTSTPTSLGSGGGNSLCGSVGGIGGGAFQLAVTGTTTILGTISANGGNGASYPCWNGGGGSGGSIYITSNVIAGTGTVSVNGGNGISGGSASGDGGGGRISILANTNSATLTRLVSAGSSYSAGAPGLGTTYPTDFPVLSTEAVTDNITGTSVTGNGTIISIGYYPVTQYGHVWSTWANPYIPNTNMATTSIGGTPVATKANQGAITNAFDGLNTTFWGSDQGVPYDLEYDFPTTTVVNKYIVTAHNSPGDSPRDWQFQAWDGVSWVNLQSISSQTGWGAYESRAFTLVNTTPYPKYRLYLSANNGGGWTRVAEIQLLNTGGNVLTNGATTTPGTFASSITGLTPNTTYHTRSYTSTMGGTVYGNDIIFSTGAANNPPNSPSSLGPNNFTTNIWVASSTPTFTFNLSDPEGSDTLKYRIILDNDSNFSSPIIDYTSALSAQGANSFTVGQAAGSGSYAIGSFGQSLPDYGSYYWKVQAIDSSTATSAFTLANSGSIAFKVDTTNPVAGSVWFSHVDSTYLNITSSGASDAGSGIASYYFVNTTNSATNGPSGSSSWSNGGLVPNSQYTYTITVIDNLGFTATTATASQYTLANIPANPTTTVISNSSILLSWESNSNSAGTEYYAENSTSEFNSGWVTSTSTLFTGLTCGTSYTFHVRARNAVGTMTNYSVSVSPSASPCNNNPDVPSSLGYSSYTNGGWVNNPTPSMAFTLVDSDASDTVKYRVQVATSSDFSALVIDYTSGLLSQGGKTFTVGQATSTGSYAVGFAGQTLLDNSNGYYWRVMAIDNNLASSAWATAAAGAVAFKLETIAPSAGSLTVISTTTNAVSLSFSGGSDAGSGLTATPYVFYNTTNWNNSGNTTATTWTNSGLVAGTYSYKVRVTDVAGNYTEVLLPSSVTVSGDGGGGGGGGDPWVGGSTEGFSVFINQNESITNTQNITLQLTGQPGTTQMLISNLSNFAGASLEPYDTTKFWDLCSGLGSCVNGTYTVYAKFYNALSQSSGSVSDNITYQILNSLTPGTLSLNSVSTSTVSVLISGSADAIYGLAVNPYTFKNRSTNGQSATSSTSSWLNTGLTPNTQYSYYAIVGNANSAFGLTSDISAYTLANPPTNLATSSITSASIALTWQANGNPVGTEYQVYNQTTNSFSGWVTSTSTIISGLACADAYEFKVKARNANGVETIYSNVVTQSTLACPITTPVSSGGTGGSGIVPINFTLAINNGSAQTENQNVTLNFSTDFSNPAKVEVSNYSDFSNSQILNYSPIVSNWSICGVNVSCESGYYTVHAKLLDNSGQLVQSVSSQIYYATSTPINSCENNSSDPVCQNPPDSTQPDAGAINDPVWVPDFTENEPLTQLDPVAQCKLFNNQSGWYGSYFDYPKNHLGMELPSNLWNKSYGDPLSNKKTWVADWYDDKYFRFAKVSPNLKFGSHFFPFDFAPQEFISGHGYHFGARWSSLVTGLNSSYNYRISSDDDSWLYVDGKLVVDNSGVHGASTKTGSINLSGTHLVQIYFAERHTTDSHFYFEIQDPQNTLSYISNNPECKTEVVANVCDTNPASPECLVPTSTPPTIQPIVDSTEPVETKTFCENNPTDLSCRQEFCLQHSTDLSCLVDGGKKVVVKSADFVAKLTSIAFIELLNSYKLLASVAKTTKDLPKVAVGLMTVAIAPTSLLMEYSLSNTGLLINAGSFADLWLKILQWFYAILAFVGIRAKRRYWGTVYDSESKQPLDPAIVELVDIQTGKVVEQNITDMLGRFGFLDRPGTFAIRAAKTNYRFPSQQVLGETDLVFDNIYHGEPLNITVEKEAITPNIPMDPLAFDWNQMDKQRLVKVHPRLEYALHIFLEIVFWSGAVYVLFNFIVNPSWFGGVFSLLYVLMGVLRRFIPHPHLWGRVLSESPNALKDLMIELHPATLPTVVVGRAVVSASGKFFLKVMPGKYVLTIKKVEGLTNKIVYKEDITVGKEAVVNQIIKI